jgi:hypothetical protein
MTVRHIGLSEADDTVRRMPSYVHETMIELFRYRPALAADLLSDLFGITLPPGSTWRST